MKEWWGLSKTDGWVVLDRDINRSLNKDSSKLLFVRASDWSTLEVPLDKWKSIPDETAAAYHPEFAALQCFGALQSIKKEWQDSIKVRIFDELHRAFLKNFGVESKGIEKYLGDFRSTRCWSCFSDVGSDDNFKCLNCRWLICNRCGACKRGGCVQPSLDRAMSTSEAELSFSSFKDALHRAKAEPGLVVTRSKIEGQWIVKRGP